MKVGIITPMPEEKKTLVERLENKVEENILNVNIIKGEYKGHEVYLTESGIGKVAAAIATTVLISSFQPEIIIHTGSSGALNPKLNIGDVVIANELAYSDVDVTAFGYAYGQLPANPARFKSDEKLVQEFKELMESKQLAQSLGLVVTGDQFITDSNRQAILDHFVSEVDEDQPELQAAEMEGAAVAQACYKQGVPFIVLRAISDTADHRSSVIFDDFVEEAGRKSADLLLAYLDNKQ